MKKSALRKKLDKIAGSSSNDIRTHPQRIEVLRGEFNHSIHLKEQQDAPHGADCISYTLGVPETLLSLVGAFPEILQDFMASNAVPEALTEIPQGQAHDGDIVLYFTAHQLKHAGYLKKGRVISKWGKNPIYEHKIGEVPASYGNTVKFYAKPGRWDVTETLIAFVQQHSRFKDLEEPLNSFLSDYRSQIN